MPATTSPAEIWLTRGLANLVGRLVVLGMRLFALAMKWAWPGITVAVTLALARIPNTEIWPLIAVAGTMTQLTWVAWLVRRRGWLRGDRYLARRRKAVRDAPDVFRACGLAVLSTPRLGVLAHLVGARVVAVERLPRVLSSSAHPLGALLTVGLVSGQKASDFTVHREALAAAWRVNDVRVTPGPVPGQVALVLVALRPLRQARFLVVDRPTLRPTVFTSEEGDRVAIDLVASGHCAVQGQTRSGKSVLAYALLASIAGHPEIVVAGSDVSGILLGPWTDAPHPELRAIGGGTVDRHAAVLEAIVALMTDRLSLLQARQLDVLPVTTEEPLILVVIEEAPGLLASLAEDDARLARKPAERLEPQARRNLGRILREGAKVGIRALLLAQRFDASLLGGDLRAQFATRVTLRVDNQDAVRLLHSDADEIRDFAQFLPGEALVQLPGEALRRCRTDCISYASYCTHLARTFPITTEPRLEEAN